ncbi:MAG: DUF4435 domain-containing protein [Bacteroidales bacterium]|nr:DUF4435 domain-containing protein [Bacteroidales bacterium]
MRMELPVKAGDAATQTIEIDNGRAVIIGANGAGKTRFARHISRQLGEKAFTLNLVEALYKDSVPDAEASDTDRLFMASHLPEYEKNRSQTPLERLISMLMHEELEQMLAYKFGDSKEDTTLPHTRLDTLMELWKRIFPQNDVLVEGGKLLFRNGMAADSFPVRRLSHGERAVLYYGAAMSYAPRNSVIFVDSPEMFLHPSTMQLLWNTLEAMRSDCTVIYVTHDVEFAASRAGATVIWVRACDISAPTGPVWDYNVLPPQDAIDDKMYMTILGERRSVLFIEGDQRSIDARLYPMIFPDRSVKPLGSCNKVIESTRTFNDLNGLHHMSAAGIVDRDRRDDAEVDYLRRKNIMVPDVAEIENILLLPEVVRSVAGACGKNPMHVFNSVSKSIMAMFRHDLHQQAMLHTRHRVKRTLEYRVDGRFADINALEKHMDALIEEIDARGLYDSFCRRFHSLLRDNDYREILKVYNQKSMLSGCNVAGLCGLKNKDEYIDRIMEILRGDTPYADTIRKAVRAALSAPAVF